MSISFDHDLDNIDKACDSLISSKRYNKGNPKPALTKIVICLQAIFQIRHTLSHNHGLVTRSDLAKLQILGFSATFGEVIDPDKNDFGLVISRFLENESKEFTKWLLDETAKYLNTQQTKAGVILDQRTLARIEQRIGKAASLTALVWV